MSCNGCRILRKGCSDTCILRPCLQWIDTPEAQANATVFVAKFFGRAGLMSFISAVPSTQRPALFQSLLSEAAGRTVNPVNGAVGLLWSGNWHVCQEAVDTVLGGGTLQPIPELLERSPVDEIGSEFPSFKLEHDFPSISSRTSRSSSTAQKRRRLPDSDLDLSLTATGFPVKDGKEQWVGSPEMNSEESEITNCSEGDQSGKIQNLLQLFN